MWGLGVCVVALLKIIAVVQACWRVYDSVYYRASPQLSAESVHRLLRIAKACQCLWGGKGCTQEEDSCHGVDVEPTVALSVEKLCPVSAEIDSSVVGVGCGPVLPLWLSSSPSRRRDRTSLLRLPAGSRRSADASGVVGRRVRVVTAPAARLTASLPLRARRPRSPEDVTPPLLPGLVGLGRATSFLLSVPLLRGPRA
ncbi:hypothetical protein NDU88_006245 [Pleurodeles waltl]|uniref:Uncharacterized protein n=1 Tax=Pleurodeles waltl TaxID=8319 RepID=A0AAV7SP41_PLEWA|nr:hypothetical protein NDU88_006245 [Pleurodeles waltl]